jgi:hypothetical protein
MKSKLTSIYRTPSTKSQHMQANNEDKNISITITAFMEQRAKSGGNKVITTLIDPTSASGKWLPAPTKEITDAKTSKTNHSNHYELLSDEFQENTRAAKGIPHGPKDSPPVK